MGSALLVFAFTYALIATRRLSVLPIGRPAGALAGACAMVLLSAVEPGAGLTPEQAFAAVEPNTIGLLLGMMLLSASLDVAGVFERAAAWVAGRDLSPVRLLYLVTLSAGLASALLLNDSVCVMMAPLVDQTTRRARLDRAPYLLALAMGANAGSALTLAGNPQNMLVAHLSGIPYRAYLVEAGPAALLGLAVTAGTLHALLRGRLARHPPARSADDPTRQEDAPAHQDDTSAREDNAHLRQDNPSARQDSAPSRKDSAPSRKDNAHLRHDNASSHQDDAPSRQDDAPSRQDDAPSRQDNAPSRQDDASSHRDVGSARHAGRPLASAADAAAARRPPAWVPLACIAGVSVAFVLGGNLAWTALGGAAAAIALQRRDASPLFERVSWTVLVFFAALFVVVAGLQKTGLPEQALRAASPHLPTGPALGIVGLSIAMIAGCQIVSNVPFILLAESWIRSQPDPHLAWIATALVSTLAGNLTLLGSVANIIVVETVGAEDEIGFRSYAKIGIPVTLASSAAAVGWLLLAR